MNENQISINRRDFLAAAGAVTLGTQLLKAETIETTEPTNQPKVRIGFIGAGLRADWLADLCIQHGGYEFAAAADYFQDKVDTFGDKFQISKNRRFTTLSGYKQLLECKEVDAVMIVSPPWFHPQQVKDALAAGKHVYLAKPVAVDVPGCQSIEASGKQATASNKVFLVDFQTRSDIHYKEAIKRVHNGAIGDFVFGECTYHGKRLQIQSTEKTQEGRLRNWVFDKALSGDIITEQNIHALDVMNWIMQTPPIKASGTGGRKVRTDVGDCWDYFTLVYEYDNNVGITFSSRQFDAQSTKPDGIRNRMFGTECVLEAHYGGKILLRSKQFYKGQSPQIYKQGPLDNITEFYTCINEGKYDNPTVSDSVQSNLVTILGRDAAYTGQTLSWQDLITRGQTLDGKLDGLKT